MVINGSTSDGFHSFDDLYNHRNLLFLALLNQNREIAWKSERHHDGTEYPGWFIAGLDLPTGAITYHLPNNLWSFATVLEHPVAPQWDGHTPQDVIARLEAYIQQISSVCHTSVSARTEQG